MGKPPIPWLRIIAEFVAIFAGVSLSLLADDWRQDREDRRRETQMLFEVIQDLERDSVEIVALLGSMRAWDEASLWVNRNAARETIPADSIFRQVRRFGIIGFYQPVSSGYRGLRDAGMMHVVADDEIRRGIVDYFEVVQPYVGQFYEVAHSGWGRWHQDASRYVDWEPAPDGATMWNLLRDGIVLRSWRELITDESFRGHADWAGLVGGNTVARLGPVLDMNSELRARIREYLQP